MHVANPQAAQGAPYPPELARLISLAGTRAAAAEVTVWPGYRPTPLVSLPALAAACGVAAVDYKDESGRFALQSFKALGGAYAVKRVLAGRDPAGVTVCCATDGNHGRSVAWGAGLFGCRSVIYVHATVSAARIEAIAAFGARIMRCPGTYDDAVRQAASDAATNGWFVVSDTSYPGYVTVPRDVMHGYTIMVDEALAGMAAPPTHAFVQAGVGGVAAAVCGHLWERYGASRPVFVTVEPDQAACIFASISACERRSVGGSLDTIMAGLACGEPSLLAWEILATGAHHALTIPDSAAEHAMRLLAASGIEAGESGAAGLAGLWYAARHPAVRDALQLDGGSRVLLFGTEGATDPAAYRSITGAVPCPACAHPDEDAA